jgi:predicted  nucleic acid-binding Zn-ribbon protein
MIDTLQRENAQLKQENDCKDRKIEKLQTQVKELQLQVATLTARLDAMNSKDGDG